MDLSVFIRTFNEELFISRCLEAVLDQTRGVQGEVVILDCGSTDRTVEIASRFSGVKVFSAPKNSFHYARALNFGVQMTTGSLFLTLSAHAIPADNHWFRELMAPILRSPEVDLVFSRQIGWPDISTPEQRSLRRNFPDKDAYLTREVLGLRLAEKHSPYDATAFSNVSSIMRRSLLERIPFREIPFSEDRLFALEAVCAGSVLAYASRSVIRHSHNPDFKSFRSVAYKSTIARHQIESFAQNLLQVSTTNIQAKLLSSRFRFLIFLLLFPFSILVALFFPLRSNRLREIRFMIASVGTSLGKIAAYRKILRAQLPPAPVADASELKTLAKAAGAA